MTVRETSPIFDTRTTVSLFSQIRRDVTLDHSMKFTDQRAGQQKLRSISKRGECLQHSARQKRNLKKWISHGWFESGRLRNNWSFGQASNLDTNDKYACSWQRTTSSSSRVQEAEVSRNIRDGRSVQFLAIPVVRRDDVRETQTTGAVLNGILQHQHTAMAPVCCLSGPYRP